jgi:hypothetical protein
MQSCLGFWQTTPDVGLCPHRVWCQTDIGSSLARKPRKQTIHILTPSLRAETRNAVPWEAARTDKTVQTWM